MLEMQDAYMDVGGRQCLEQIVEQFPAPVSKLCHFERSEKSAVGVQVLCLCLEQAP